MKIRIITTASNAKAVQIVRYKPMHLDDPNVIHSYRELPAWASDPSSGWSCRSHSFGAPIPLFIKDAFASAVGTKSTLTNVRIFGPIYGPDSNTCFVIASYK